MLKKTKILLSFVYNDEMNATMEDIGLSFIGAYLRQNGYEVLFDFRHEADDNFDEILKFGPDIAGLSVYTMSQLSVGKISTKLKAMMPDVVITVGGVYVTYDGNEFLKNYPCVDCIIRGEGEATFLELCDQAESGNFDFAEISGLTYRTAGEIAENPDRPLIADIKMLPPPARDLLRKMDAKVALISTSRGCYGHCSFCSSQLFWKRWRGIDEEEIVNEMERVINESGIRVFNIIDGSFEDPDGGLNRAANMARIIIQRKLFVYFFICVRAELYKKVTPEILRLLTKAGLCSVCVGVESGNDDDLRLYSKIATVADNKAMLSLLNSYKIKVSPGFICFNPFSTMERLQQNISFLSDAGFPIKFFTYLDLYNHTRIYSKADAANLITGVEAGKYIYRYQDESVGRLAAFFIALKDRLNENGNNYYNRMDYYAEGFKHSLFYYERLFQAKLQKDNLEHVRETQAEVEKIYLGFNEFLGEQVNLLLTIYKERPSVDMLEACITQQKFISRFTEYVKKVDRQRDKLNLFLARNGYWNILINV